MTLLYVTDPAAAGAAHGAFTGLLGRGPHGRDPARVAAGLDDAATRDLLVRAAAELGRPPGHPRRRQPTAE